MPLHSLHPPPFAAAAATAAMGEPSSASDATVRVGLRKPNCLAAYEQARQPQGSAPDVAMASSPPRERAPPRWAPRGDPMDKLAAYRRARSSGAPAAGGRAVHSTASDGMERTVPSALTAQLPREMTAYILELEEQNRQLRQHVLELQESSRQSLYLQHMQSTTQASVARDATISALLGPGFAAQENFVSKEERESYMNSILAQVESIVQAHRNQSEADILKYKQQAESAQMALRQLREAVALEGVDLALLPAAMAALTGHACNITPATSAVRDSTSISNEGAASEPVEQLILAKCASAVDAATNAVLSDLLRVEAGDDVPAVVHNSVRRGFSSLVHNVSEVVAAHFAHCTREVRYLHEERDRVRSELRSEVAAGEAERLRLSHRYETELRTLHDELRAFHVAAASGDELRAAVHERALDECGALLSAARSEADALRRELEEERSTSAATCLRLKASLQRRSADFEAAVTRRAGEVVAAADRRRAEAEAEAEALRGRDEARALSRVSRAVQAEVRDPLRIDEAHYMANVLSLLSTGEQRGGAAGLNQSFGQSAGMAMPELAAWSRDKEETESKAHTQESFEEDVWAKTIELINKYGGVTEN